MRLTLKTFNLLCLTLVFSCAKVSEKDAKLSNMELDNFIHFEEGAENFDKSSAFELAAVDDIKITDRLDGISKSDIPDPLKDYANKKFVDNSVASRYNLSEVPGHIYKKNDDGRTYSRVSTQRFVLEDLYPKAETVDKIYYNNKVTKKAGLDVVVLIFKISIGSNEIVELIVKDDLSVSLPDAMINNTMLLAFKERFKDNLDNYYFATGATLSSVSYKTFKERRFKKGVDASWFTSGGDIYASEDDFKFKTDVALELISLKDMIIIK